MSSIHEWDTRMDGIECPKEEPQSPNDTTTQIKIDELLNTDFMTRHTQFKSFGDFTATAVKKLGQPLMKLSAESRNRFVSETTNFDSWDAMLITAGSCFFAQRLGL